MVSKLFAKLQINYQLSIINYHFFRTFAARKHMNDEKAGFTNLFIYSTGRTGADTGIDRNIYADARIEGRYDAVCVYR
jgi:hypothetical protein